MASTIAAGTTSGTAIAIAGDTSGVLQLQTNGTTAAVTINTSQNVGVGTTSPDGKLTIETANSNTPRIRFQNASFDGDAAISTFVSSTGTDLVLGSNTYINSSGNLARFDSAQAGSYVYAGRTGSLFFGTNDTSGVATERMRIDSSGRLLAGTTSPIANCMVSIEAFATGSTGMIGGRFASNTSGKYYTWGPTSDSSPYWIVYNESATGVYLAPGGNTWTSGSDETLKDIIEPIQNGAEKVASLRAVIGKYKTDEAGTRRSFLIAQDVQKVLPEAINQTPEGKLGLQYTDVIPLLVAAIQELKTTVDAQAVRIAELEGAR